MKRYLLIIAALGLAGCATRNPANFVRVDGQPIDDRQWQVAHTICRAEVIGQDPGMRPTGTIAGDAVSAIVQTGVQYERLKGCMAARGYVLAEQ